MTECPLCNGNGIIYMNKKEMDIQAMRQNGLTIRQIAKLVGKSPTTVFYHLTKYEKNSTKSR